MIQQQPGGQQQLLMLQPTQVMSGPPTPSTPTQPVPVYGSPQRASPPGTTSDDSDDSVPSHHSQVNNNKKLSIIFQMFVNCQSGNVLMDLP